MISLNNLNHDKTGFGRTTASVVIKFTQIYGEWSIAGWWYTYPSEKYESQLGLLFSIYGKIKNVPNHQPDCKIGFQEGAVRGSPMATVRWRVASFPRPFSEFTMFYLWKVVFFPQRKKRISRWPLFRGRRVCATAILMKHVMIRKQIHRGIAFLSNAKARPVWLTCDCFGTTEGTFCETLDLMM